MVNSTVELKDKLSLIHSEIQAFRKESQSRMENGQKVWQLVIGGLAALVVLKNDVDLIRFFPVAPVIAMLAHYLESITSSFVTTGILRDWSTKSMS